MNDWYDIPAEEMTKEQAQKAVKDLRKALLIARTETEQAEKEGPQGTWKPISESWPAIKGYYLTTTIHHEVYCDFWNGENFDRTEAVIAWMDLPDPFESESEAAK